MAVSSSRSFASRYQKYASQNVASQSASSHAHDDIRWARSLSPAMSSEPGFRAFLHNVFSKGVFWTRNDDGVAPSVAVAATVAARSV